MADFDIKNFPIKTRIPKPKKYTGKEYDNLHADFLKEIDMGKEFKQDIEASNIINHRFLIGDHWLRTIRMNDGINIASPINTISGPRPKTNLTRVHLEKVRGKLLKYTSLPSVYSNTQNESDKLAAEFGKMYLKNRYINDRDKEKLIHLYTLILRDGCAFRRLRWNPLAGQMKAMPVKGKRPYDRESYISNCVECNHVEDFEMKLCPMCYSENIVTEKNSEPMEETYTKEVEQMTEKEERERWKYTGIPETEVVPMFRIILDPAASFNSELRWLYDEQQRDATFIYNYWGVRLLEDELHGVDSEYRDRQSEIRRSAPGFQTGNVDPKYLEGHTIIYEGFRKPSERFPDGLYVVMTRERFLHIEDSLPWQKNMRGEFKKDWPYVKSDYSVVPGRIYSMSLVEDLVPIQKQLNQLDRHIIKWTKRNMGTKYFIHDQADVNISQLTGDEGTVWEYTHLSGYPEPIIVPGTNLPSDMWRRRQDLVKQMDYISGVADVEKAMPASGVAMGVFQEMMEERFGPIIEGLELSEADYHRWKLIIAQDQLKYEIKLKIVGEDGKEKVENFQGTDLQSNFDVRVDFGSGRVRSQALDQQLIMDFLDRGLLNVQDPKTAHEIRKKHNLEGFATEYSTDHGKMIRFIDKIKNNEEVNPEWWDNPHVMYGVLREFAQSSGFDNLIKEKPQIKEKTEKLLQHYYEQAGLAEEKFQDRANQGTEPRPIVGATPQTEQQNLLNPVPTGQQQVA